MGEVRVEERGRVLLATLDNPPHGLMDSGTVAGLEAVVARAEAEPGVGGVVLTGAHPERFVAHYDVGELLAAARAAPSVGPRAAHASLRAVGALRRVPRVEDALGRTPAAGLVLLERFHATLLRMNRCGAVFVAAINGSAMGGGSELALACDVRLMADGDHLIGQPEILFAFPPGGGGTQRLARLLGTARALRIVLEGGPLSPAQAAALGYVDEVIAPGELVDRAVALAERLGSREKAAIGACKRAVYDGGSLPLADGLRLERAEFLAGLGSPEAQTAMTAYLEALERTGELPGYDRAALERAVESGAFRPGA
ncbi:MAG: enoyl-CoA hydratase/isomerase family protein [Actinobacteria bacterium]|nr:MAG: enoyl-CoA hydratase/isomerase family protein [Actinomycetota bacterium]